LQESEIPAAIPEPVPSPESDGGPGGLFGRYSILFAADTVARGLRFLADIILFRHFGETVFGQFNVAQMLTLQGMSLSTCGLDTAGTRDIASGSVPAPTMALTVFLLRLVLGVVAWTIIAGVALIVPQYRDSLLLVALYGLSIFTGAATLGWVAQARGQVGVVARAVVIANLGYFAGVWLTAQNGWAPASVPLGLAISEAAVALGLWIWLIRAVGPIARPLPISEALTFLRISIPIGVANFLRMLTLGSDVLLLGLFIAEADVGQYSVGFKLYSVSLSVLALYFVILLPHLAREASRSPAAIRQAVHSALRRSLLAAIPLTGIGLLLAGSILHLLFARESAGATRVFQILLLALPAVLASGHFRTALIALKRQQLDVGLVAAATIIHVAAKLLLIPILGMTGAAWGTLVGECALLVLAWNAARKAMSDSARQTANS
jgi:O-antigen/teichoic acid export membrane protein